MVCNVPDTLHRVNDVHGPSLLCHHGLLPKPRPQKITLTDTILWHYCFRMKKLPALLTKSLTKLQRSGTKWGVSLASLILLVAVAGALADPSIAAKIC